MTDKLAEICAIKREHVAAAQRNMPLHALEDLARQATPVRGFAAALSTKVAAGDIGLIGEIKKASPSAGLIRPDFDPAHLAQTYAQGGAACLSVLTDAPYFQGNNDYLKQARAACALPALRKDFMIDVWQVVEARAIGADCILIIMAAVDDALATDLYAAAVAYGMDVLIETHDETELERALAMPSGLIGVNNRNLKTLKTDLATTERLAPLVPQGRDIVCESGIASSQDVARMIKAGVRRFLVGESLMRQDDVAAASRALRPV